MNLKQIIWEFSKKYNVKAAELEKAILTDINNGMKVETAVKNAFAKTATLDETEQFINDARSKAVGISFGNKVDTKEITTALNRPFYGDDTKLSDRIHLGGEQMKQAIISEVKAQLKLGANITQMARSIYTGYGYGQIDSVQELPKYLDAIVNFARRSDLDTDARNKLLRLVRQTRQKADLLKNNNTSWIKKSYQTLLDAVEKGDKDNIAKAIKFAINEKSRYVAERIARTESARAYFDGVVAKWQDNPDVIAYHWKLSTAHIIPDICNMYADCNFYGLGSGIYPKDKLPGYPAHPNCMCLLNPVFKGDADLTKLTNNPQKAGEQWLKAHPDAASFILPTKVAANEWWNNAYSFNGFMAPKSRLSNSLKF